MKVELQQDSYGKIYIDLELILSEQVCRSRLIELGWTPPDKEKKEVMNHD